MNNLSTEAPFRAALAVVVVLTTTVAAYHRFRAMSKERISHEEEGLLFALVLRLLGLSLWLSTLAYLIYPPSIQWAKLPLPAWVRWLGVAVGVLCSALMYWILSCLGKNLTDTVVTRESATLVTHGPYRWVRHPFYVTAALLMGSVTLLTANGLIGATSLLILGMLYLRTPKEEEMLLRRFGQEYRDYCARTGRYVPRILG
jgi:protein-S-isoprenylcysteine O-methyltransferase Ste14